jgi:hypothetical protein
MFGLFKKSVDSIELTCIFLKVVSPLLENQKNIPIDMIQIENAINAFLQNQKPKISQEQLLTLKYASQIVCMSEELQEKIINLHHATEADTKDKFLDVLDNFRSYGCFA